MIIDNYIIRLNRKWLAERTISWYLAILNNFDKYLIRKSSRSIEDCEKICIQDIDSYMNIRAKKVCMKTCNLELSAIKSYINYCSIIWKQVINTNAIIRWKTVDKEIESLKDDDTRKLLEYFRDIKATKKREIIKRRNYCICWLLTYTWLRVSELLSLKRNQIWKVIQIIWKGRKLRSVNLFDEDLEVINNYLKLRTDKKEDLFVSFDCNKKYKYKRLSKVSIEHIIREWWKKAWLSERVRPHKLRHTFATNLLRSWAKLECIQKLLWHSSLATTQIYLTVLNSELIEAQSKMKRF